MTPLIEAAHLCVDEPAAPRFAPWRREDAAPHHSGCCCHRRRCGVVPHTQLHSPVALKSPVEGPQSYGVRAALVTVRGAQLPGAEIPPSPWRSNAWFVVIVVVVWSLYSPPCSQKRTNTPRSYARTILSSDTALSHGVWVTQLPNSQVTL